MSLGRALECRRRRSGWSVTSSSRFGLLQLVALLSSHPLFYRILAWPHARSDGAAAFGDRKISLVRKVCENDKIFWKNF